MAADYRRDCGVSAEPANMNDSGNYGGGKHDWRPTNTVNLN
jgi:hypothetical protein